MDKEYKCNIFKEPIFWISLFLVVASIIISWYYGAGSVKDAWYDTLKKPDYILPPFTIYITWVVFIIVIGFLGFQGSKICNQTQKNISNVLFLLAITFATLWNFYLYNQEQIHVSFWMVATLWVVSFTWLLFFVNNLELARATNCEDMKLNMSIPIVNRNIFLELPYKFIIFLNLLLVAWLTYIIAINWQLVAGN